MDVLRGGTLVDAGRVKELRGIATSRDPFRERVEEVTGQLVLVQPGNALWLELQKAVVAGDIYRAMSMRNRLLLSHKLTITERFARA